MNTKMQDESAEYILEHCDLLVKSDCVILDGVLYEYCRPDADLYPTEAVRYFFNTDDYDYVPADTARFDIVKSMVLAKN